MNMEVKFSALKGYLDCEISSLNSKVDLFIESLKETITKVEKSDNSNMEILQESIRFLQKNLLAKSDITKSLTKTQRLMLRLTNLKEKPKDQQELPNVTSKQQIQQHHQGHQNNQQKFQTSLKQQHNHHRQS